LILTTSVNGLHSTKFQTVLIRSHLSLQQRLWRTVSMSRLINLKGRNQ